MAAFGTLITNGTGSATGASIGATNQININGGTGVAVVVGDLIVCVGAEQTSETWSGATDSLGHTYSALNSSGTTVGGQAFYVRVTTPGTLTSVTMNATSSTHDFACCAAAFNGPFVASPLDTNPANGTADTTDPYTCPLSGTLAQANEMVIAWAAHNANNAWTANSPNIIAATANRANAACALGSQAVTATTSVSGTFSGTAPTVVNLGTASFKRDELAAADHPGFDTSTRRTELQRGSRRPELLQNRTWQFSLLTDTLHSAFTAADTNSYQPTPFDWQITYGTRPTYTWVQNLLGTTLAPSVVVTAATPGQQLTALPPQRIRPALTWTNSLFNTALSTAGPPVDTNTYQPRPFDWQVTYRVGKHAIWNEPQNLRPLQAPGAEQPVGKTALDLPQRYPVQLRTWTNSNVALLSQAAVVVVAERPHLPPLWPLGPRPISFQWQQPENLLPGLLSTAGPAAPTTVDQPRPFEWGWIGRARPAIWQQPQNTLPLFSAEAADTQLREPLFTPRYVRPPLRWSQPPNLTVTLGAGTDSASLPQRNRYEWPVPLGARPAYPNSLRTWINYEVHTTTGTDSGSLPQRNRYEWAPPLGAKLPYTNDLRTWLSNPNMALLSEAGAEPAPEPPPSVGGGAGFVVHSFTRKKCRELLAQIEREKKKAEVPEAKAAAVALKEAVKELPYCETEHVAEIEALLDELRALRLATINAREAAIQARVIQREAERLQLEIEEDEDEEMLLSGGWM